MNTSPQNFDSVGYLVVNVSTARGVIPLSDASVNIRGGEAENSGILFSLRTDRDGKTEKVALPTPPRSESQAPGYPVPYAVYNIEVFKDGYLPLSFQNVPIFPSVVSIQPAVMVPAPNDLSSPYSSYGASTVLPEPEKTDLN